MDKKVRQPRTDGLDVIEFGRKLLETNDLDPVYVVLWGAQLPEDKLKKWLLAYWCFYHVGTASWIADHRDYWQAMELAAGSKEWPRAHERRHFRGKNATNSVAFLKSLGVVELFARLLEPINSTPPGIPLKTIMERVKTWVGFGPWIAFKIADMLDRLALVSVRFAGESIFLFDSPKEGAELMREYYGNGEADHPYENRLEQWAVDTISEELATFKAPPRYERQINSQEAETILCKWKSYMYGHYHLGEDIEAVQQGLLRFSKTKTCQLLLTSGSKQGLWKC